MSISSKQLAGIIGHDAFAKALGKARPTPQAAVPKSRYKSKLEADYAAQLHALKASGEVLEWLYERTRLSVGIDENGKERLYTPDFDVLWANGLREYVECKGYQWPAAMARFYAAKKIYSHFVFRLVEQ